MRHVIKVENNRIFDGPVMMIARNDKAIDLYLIDKHGLEQYAGRLEHPIDADEQKIVVLLKAIKARIKERPLSRESLHWLSCLSEAGMLARWEDPHVPPTTY
jgi:hypothetical protein